MGFQDYEEYKCIKEMNESDKQRFAGIVQEYAPRLNRIVSDGGTIYTFHDFDHHCCDMYRIVGDIILYRDTAFRDSDIAINKKELYLLNLAILLHDIGMTQYIDFTRDNHSVISVEILKNDYQNASNPLTESKSGLSPNEFEALCLMIKAHSDVKDGSIKEEENGLRNPKLTNTMPGRPREIKARFLASILRMADELDITSDRLGAMDVRKELETAVLQKNVIEQQLANVTEIVEKEKLKEKLQRYKSAEISQKFWNKLSYFKTIRRNEKGIVELIIDDDAVAGELGKGSDEKETFNDILEVYEKVIKEFEAFQEEIGKDLQYRAMVAMKEITLVTDNPKILRERDKREQRIKVNKKKKRNEIVPHIISSELEKEITEFIEKRNLYDVGHYKLRNDLCARDWVYVNEIVTTEAFFRKCEKQLLLHIGSLSDLGERYLILGIDFCGMLVASRLATILHQPYDYLIPEYRKPKSSLRELSLEVSIEKINNIIIVIDVIVTFRTLKALINDYRINKEAIKAVYAILYRNTGDSQLIEADDELINKTYVLNGSFPIECKENSECKYKDTENCKASNKIFD